VVYLHRNTYTGALPGWSRERVHLHPEDPMEKPHPFGSASPFLPPGQPAAGAPSTTTAVRPLGTTRRSLLPRHLPPLAPLALARPVVHRLTEPEFPPVAPPSYAPVVVPTAMPVMSAEIPEVPVVAPPALASSLPRLVAAPRVSTRRPPVRVAMTLDLEPDGEPPTNAASQPMSPEVMPEVAAPESASIREALFTSEKEVRDPPPFLLMDSCPNVTDALAVDGVMAEHDAPPRFSARAGSLRRGRGVGLAIGLGVVVITVLGLWGKIFPSRETVIVAASQASPATVTATATIEEAVAAQVEAAPPALAESAALVVADPSAPKLVAPTIERKPARRSSRAALQRLGGRARACRKLHRAVGGPEILVWYGVGGNGRAIRPQASVSGPLAQCLVEAVRTTKFPKRRQMDLEALL